MSWIKSNVLRLTLLLYVLFVFVILLFFDGTGDSGDSILHFLYAQSAPTHPELYLNHWGKPMFTLLASPFAQFGFIGMKVFNCLTVLATLYLVFKAAVDLKLERPIVAVLIIICAPLLILHTFSGLTEPLFALFIAWGLFLVLRKKWWLACIVISFLPFVRSEGLILVGVFGLYYILKNQWKLLPLFLVGHVVYSLVGTIYYNDFLWVFTKIPYASGSIYGHGDLFQFVNQLPFVIGVPSVLLLAVGLFVLLQQLVTKRFHSELHGIVLFGFLSYFIAHSLFWYFGIFGSMGLNRVLLGVMPFIAIIALIGANSLIQLVASRKLLAQIVTFVLISVVVVFPVLDNPSAVHWKRDMNLSAEQKVVKQLALEVLRTEGSSHRFMYAPPYLSIVLNLDHFNQSKRVDINPTWIEEAKKGDIIIWDNWFSVVDCHVSKEMLDARSDLREICTVKGRQKDSEVIYTAYIVE